MKNTKRNELAVCGFATVKLLEKKHPERIRRLYFNNDRARLFGGICKKLAAEKRIYNMVDSDGELESLCGTVHHQGVVAMIDEPQIPPLTRTIAEGWAAERQNVIVLDHIGNTNNLGAIIRSAAYFGIRNIVLSLDKEQAPISTSTYRIAEGGMEFVDIYSARSIAYLLKDMKGKMMRFATVLRSKTPISQIRPLAEGKGSIVVLGNEEEGISKDAKQNCDHIITIPYPGIELGSRSNVESLNVAQAASVIMYELSKR